MARLVGGEGRGVIGGGDMWVAVRRGELQSCSCRMADEMDDGRECAVAVGQSSVGSGDCESGLRGAVG
jgi:hypothetical protein